MSSVARFIENYDNIINEFGRDPFKDFKYIDNDQNWNAKRKQFKKHYEQAPPSTSYASAAPMKFAKVKPETYAWRRIITKII